MPRAQFSLRSVSLGGLVLLLVVGCGQAQIDRATLTGTETDPTRAVVRDAKIHAKDQATGLESEAESNSQGVYRAPALAAGTYTVTVTHAGFAGRGRDDNNYTMDGVDATGIHEQAQKSTTRLQISEEAVAEYRVSSILYTAEHGAGAGGQADLVSKTGTNVFHGSLFEFFRNSALDARQFTDFDTVTGLPIRPPFHLNQYGLSLGGPIKRDKTFFFLTY